MATDSATDQRYQQGTTNSWSYLSVDPELGLVYVPTGNTSPDYYGGHRGNLDYYSSSVVALSVAGERSLSSSAMAATTGSQAHNRPPVVKS